MKDQHVSTIARFSLLWKQKKSFLFSINAILILFCSACSRESEEDIKVTLLQINDVYEIEALSGGKLGGLSRVATIRKRLLEETPNTLTIMAGDFFSPSALGTAKIDGKRLDGEQMVAVLNTLGLDYATFGNHEFDIKKEPFYNRLAESEFKWVTCNVFDEKGERFPGTISNEVLTFTNQQGSVFKLGITGVTLDENDPEYVSFSDPISSLKAEVELVQKDADAIVAITHLDFVDDQAIAEKITDLDLIIGGHDHENMLIRRGENFTPIAKADANAKSVFIHRLTFSPQSRSLSINSSLLRIDDQIPHDPDTGTVVKRWVEKGFEGFEGMGFTPSEIVATSTESFDGREVSVRYQPTNLTQLIGDAIKHEAPDADLGLFNGGSIRIDDKLTAGPISQYDVLRVLPFPGTVLSVSITGELLIELLTLGRQQPGNGSFLQSSSNVYFENGTWMMDQNAIESNLRYTVAANDFLANGNERVFNYFDIKKQSERFALIGSHGDMRRAVIDELKRRFPVED